MGSDFSCQCGDANKDELQQQEDRAIIQNKNDMAAQLAILTQQQKKGYDQSLDYQLYSQPLTSPNEINDPYLKTASQYQNEKVQNEFNKLSNFQVSTNFSDQLIQPDKNKKEPKQSFEQLPRDSIQFEMKAYEELLPHFVKESDLFYEDYFVYSNNSVYRGQMKHLDDDQKHLIARLSETSYSNSRGGAIQNRLSFKAKGINDNGDPRKSENSSTIIRHGYGVQYWPDGAHYEGQWQYNIAEGHGTFWHAEGDIYTGDFKNDMANGYGEYIHTNGSKYVGEFKDDVQEGHGEEEWVDGAKYVGSYKAGLKDGYGVYKWANGSLYKGNWKENKISGYGEYTWNDERTYQGYWLENNMHGQGVYSWADGRKYEGDYKDDKKHGYGIYTYPDGRSYKGQWENGKQHGEGIFITPQGAEKKGIWNEGKRAKWVD